MSVFVLGVNLLSANRSGGMAELEGALNVLVFGKCSGFIVMSAHELQALQSARVNDGLCVCVCVRLQKPVGCMKCWPSWMDAVCLVTQ